MKKEFNVTTWRNKKSDIVFIDSLFRKELGGISPCYCHTRGQWVEGKVGQNIDRYEKLKLKLPVVVKRALGAI